MSRVYQKQPAPTTRRAPGAPPPVRPSNPTTSTSTTHGIRAPTRGGTRAPTRGGTVRPPPPVPRQENHNNSPLHENNRQTFQERTTHVGLDC